MKRTLPTLHVNFSNEVHWQTCSSSDSLGDAIHIWKVKVDQFCALFRAFRSVLSTQELNKAGRFFKEEDYKRYLTGRILLRLLLSKYLSILPASISFATSSKKPSIHNEKHLDFNLSYSGEFILIAFGNCQSGVDIEKLKVHFDYQNLLVPCFSNDEIQDIKRDEKKSMHTFFLHWTRKEALLKYTGQGIVDKLMNVPSLDGTHFLSCDNLKINENTRLQSFFLDQTCIGSVAYPSCIKKVSFFEWGDTSTLYKQTHDNS